MRAVFQIRLTLLDVFLLNMHLKKCQFVLLGVIFLVTQNANSQNDGKQSCDLNEDEFGECTSYTECPEVISKIPEILPVFCPSNDGDPLPQVCCPIPVPDVTVEQRLFSIPKEAEALIYKPSAEEKLSKSYLKCQEWSELAYIWKRTNLVPGSPVEKVPNCAFKVKPLITGGEPALLKEFPHMVILGYVDDEGTSWKCGGSLISEQYVLTAKHCLLSRQKRVPPTIAHVGLLNLKNRNDTGSLQVFNITDLIKYPNSNRTKYNDIALIKLDRPVTFSEYVRPACLHFEREYNAQSGISTGWGDLIYGANKNSETLMKVKLPFVSHDICYDTYKLKTDKNFINGVDESTQFCAGEFRSNKDSCQGDSGGPLQIYRTDIYCMYDIVGVTSFGVDCGKEPGIYTRVSHYRSWIESVVWPLE